MVTRFNTFSLITLILALLLNGCSKPVEPEPGSEAESNLPWPKINIPVAKDPAMEQQIREMLEQMPLEQKVGQMMQPSIAGITPEEVKQYYIGSILNGGGMFPNGNRTATAREWAALADEYFKASMQSPQGLPVIPVLWATDAVHGHNNVIGATLFPHNSALGAAHNPELVRQIAEVTAREMVATGLDWNFAPTVAVAKNPRWGRTYESYSEDPSLVAALSASYIAGLQGAPGKEFMFTPEKVIATAKHFIGDGGTARGDDQGETTLSEQELIAQHALGYFASLSSGAQTVMASYSSWNGLPMHAHKYLLTDVLKKHMGFDGLVVSDWNALGHVNGCTRDNCAEAINAGVDVLMVPFKPDWQKLITNTIAQVNRGDIPMARIDDAVARILRVKLRYKAYNKGLPSKRVPYDFDKYLAVDSHQALARDAVRQSLVLLKNNGSLLPLSAQKHILVAGDAANSIPRQTGGWTVSWQGNDTTDEDFPVGQTIYAGLAEASQAAGGRITLSEDGSFEDKPDVAIVVFGEQASAEMVGDLENLRTLEFNREDPQALLTLKKLRDAGIPTVSVFLAGRPRLVNLEMNQSDAFVMAWQPGTAGGGIADVILAGQKEGSENYDFNGTLPFSWPSSPCPDESQPLFKLGYGLTLETESTVETLAEDYTPYRFGCDLANDFDPSQVSEIDLNTRDYSLHLELKSLEKKPVKPSAEWQGMKAAVTRGAQGEIQQIDLTWTQAPRNNAVLQNGKVQSLIGNLVVGHALQLEVNITSTPSEKVWAKMECGHLCADNTLEITDKLKTLPLNEWKKVYLPLSCIAGNRTDLHKINSVFRMDSSGDFSLSLRKLKVGAIDQAEALNLCE